MSVTSSIVLARAALAFGLLGVASSSCSVSPNRDDPSFRYGRDQVFPQVANTPHPGRSAEDACRDTVRAKPSPIKHYRQDLALDGCLEGVRVVLN